MKISKILFVGTILGAGYWLLNRVAANVLITWIGIKWLGRDGLKLRFALLYEIGNQNNMATTVTSFKGNLLYGDYKLNEVSIDQAITVEPGETKAMQVNFTLNPGTMLAEIMRFVEQRDGFKTFRLKGVMKGKLGDVPYAYPVNENLRLAND